MSATCSDARTVGDWLSGTARRLGTADPGDRLGDVLAGAFARPMDDAAYRGNALVPGGWPLEVSFSEERPDRLRLDLQPSDVECLPVRRRARTLTVVGRHAGTGFHRRYAAWRPYLRADRFGAFLGAEFGPDDLTSVKAYLELDPAVAPAALPGRLGAAASMVAAHVPGVVPHLVAIGGGLDGPLERVYLACRGGLRILALDGLLAGLGLRHRLPALAATVAELTGGRLLLPEDAALVAVAERAGGLDLKVELLSDALAGPAEAAIERLLLDRPSSLAAFRRWRHAVGPAVTTSVVSVRLAGDSPPRLNVYQRIAAPDRLRP
ncbi:hypothetical protein [Asanoa ishikariensis]|uniref:hypothetical protein n=1 Tax=Asanoa ishikariensis TaxID=137265 RepID=UPI00115FBEA0|nr:hypothetical protein [Asanoa ishikariensis]